MSFLDNSGAFVAQPTILQQKLHKLEDLAEAETAGSESVDVQIDNVSKVPIYVRVDGTDENGKVSRMMGDILKMKGFAQ